MGVDDEQTGMEVKEVEVIDRDVSCGVCDDYLLCWMGVGGRLVVCLRRLIVLVVMV